jgi:hypothetical protein
VVPLLAIPVAFRLLGVAALLLVAFVASQSRSRRPLLPLSLVRDRNRAGAYLIMLLMAIGPLHVLRHHPAPPARLNVLGGGIDSIDPGATVLVPTLGSLAYDTLSRRPHAGQVVMPWRAAAFGETGAGWPSAPGGAHMWAGVMPHPTTGTGEGPWCVLRSRRDDGCSGGMSRGLRPVPSSAVLLESRKCRASGPKWEQQRSAAC